ncbi:MFS transporter [Actinoallomurus purpureus]|uniref:MFS transporter n=1 Tax=Actinoallomurus purpureus TaxID=478114 RepID=UPI0020922B12|nr:MFS transporter [Actinoallomurus purpureus]MCO6007732.1 MFS transporter [Actinoallomurus purpureus]
MAVRLLLLMAGTFFIGTDVFVIAGMLPEIGDSLGVSIAAVGQLMTGFAISYALLGPLLSSLLSSRSPRMALPAALGAVAVGNLICAGADSFLVAMLGRVLVAAGASQFTPHASALAAELVPEDRRGKALASVTGGLAMGSVLGVPAGTWAASAFGWRPTLVVLILGTASVAVALSVSLRGVGVLRPSISVRARFATLRTPAIRSVLVLTGVIVTAEYCVYTYVSAVFGDVTHGNGNLLAVLLLSFGLGGVSGNAIAGALMDRPAGRHIVLVAVVGQGVNFLLLPLTSQSFASAIIAMALWGVTGWMYAAPQQHRLLRLAGPAGPLAMAANSSVIYIGVAIGGAMGGVFLGNMKGNWLALPAAAVCALALIPEVLFRRAEAERRKTTGGSSEVSADQVASV